MSVERARVCVFLICLCSFLFVVLVSSLVLAKQYTTEADSEKEAGLPPQEPCIAQDRPQPFQWQLRSEDGTTIDIGSIDVRQRC